MPGLSCWYRYATRVYVVVEVVVVDMTNGEVQEGLDLESCNTQV